VSSARSSFCRRQSRCGRTARTSSAPHTDLAGSPKQPETRAADYARERIALITEADALIGPYSVWRHNLVRELRCWRRLLDLLRSRAEQRGLKGAHNARHGSTGEAL